MLYVNIKGLYLNYVLKMEWLYKVNMYIYVKIYN